MSEQVINPDLSFVNEVIKSGGETLKKCYQCSTCTVVCNVTPEENPFPRKEMLYAQWGMKEKLFNNPDIWLCHQCSDCTAYCPRGAKPGEVLGAVRKLSIKNYATPRFLGAMAGDPKSFLLLLAIPIIIFFMVIASQGNLSSVPRGDDGGIVYSKFIPIIYIDTIFSSAALFATIVFVLGIMKYWKDLSRGVPGPRGNLAAGVTGTIKDILTHRKFKTCNVTKARSISHLFVFYSFIGLTLTTMWAVVYLYGHKLLGIQGTSIFHFGESPFPLYDPLKILGNASALILIIGITLVVGNRLKNKVTAGIGSYFDWLFIGVIYLIAVTGIFSELLRLANIATLAYPIYFAHLVFVFFLFAYAPFSKMAHMVYRATAMAFARYTKREI